MTHDSLHLDLLRGFALGVLTDAEVEQVTHLLETCQGCPDALKRIEEREDQAMSTIHVGMTITGWRRDVDAVIAQIKSLVTPGMLVEDIPLRAGASADVEDAVIITASESSAEALRGAIEALLANRRNDQERASRTTVRLGVRMTGSDETPLDLSRAVEERNVRDVALFLFASEGENEEE
jgi:hypothetical protein